MLGALIGAGTSLLGGLLGNKSAKKAQKAQIKASQQQAALAKQASDEANATQLRIAAENVQHQKDFAQQGIQWKVKDSLAAGIHPLFGLGAATTSFAPVSVGSSTPSYYGDPSRTADMSMANAVSNMGQDIGRAVDATQTIAQKAMTAFQLERAKLENDLLRVNINKSVASSNPPFPGPSNSYLMDGQGATQGLINEQAQDRVVTNPGAPGNEPGSINELGWVKTKNGYAPVFSKDMADRMDENWPASIGFAMRNYVAPLWGGGSKPPASPPKGTEWSWNGLEYVPKKVTYRPYPRQSSNPRAPGYRGQ